MKNGIGLYSTWALLAHELRNPLAPILNSLAIMRRARKLESSSSPRQWPGESGPGPTNPADTAMDVLDRQVGHMVKLVDDLLDAGRISRGKLVLRKQRVELSSVVHHAVEAARPLCESLDQEMRLPILVETAALPAPAMAPDPAATATGLRILVVDDNRDAADMLAMFLQVSGHETHTAHDGVEAIEATTRLQPDLVLLDIGLPRLNGYEAGRRIREQHKRGAPVLVALSGWGQDEDRRRSEEAGFDAHLVKPVDEIVRPERIEASVVRERSLLTTGSGRFPVRGYAPLLSRIMDDQGECTPERRTSDV